LLTFLGFESEMLVVKAQITRGAGFGAMAAVAVASVNAVNIFSIVAGCKHLLRANVAGREEDRCGQPRGRVFPTRL
jgi:hypothetical protein